jgi:hypothetical protein
MSVDNRLDDTFTPDGRIASEFGRALALGNVEPDLAVRGFARALPGRACRLLLPGQRLIETGAVDANAARAQRIFSEVVRKSICIVELERRLTGQAITFTHGRCRLVEQL